MVAVMMRADDRIELTIADERQDAVHIRRRINHHQAFTIADEIGIVLDHSQNEKFDIHTSAGNDESALSTGDLNS